MACIGSWIAAIFLVINFEILLFTNHLGGGGGVGEAPKEKEKEREVPCFNYLS